MPERSSKHPAPPGRPASTGSNGNGLSPDMAPTEGDGGALREDMPESEPVADRDTLTGLPGRATLQQRFIVASETAKRDGKRLGILFLDLDGFKQLNDGLSHRAGDAALQHVARCLKASVRGSDTVSRHGGDEFLILLTDLTLPADAARVAEKMLSSLMTPERIGERMVSLSASIGICIYPDDGSSLDELMDKADIAMYTAKRQVSGCYMFFNAAQPVPFQVPAPLAEPDVIYPHAESPDEERRRQGQMQEANQQLLFAVLSAQELQSAAQRALDEQTALMARVAHELRNPLTPIRMAASLIDRAHLLELPQLREVIERQVAHVSCLVGDLLDLSRAKVGKLRLQRSVLDIGALLSEAIEAARPAMGARRQQLETDIPDRPLLVDGDRVRLTQVLSNLFDNASKYTPEGGSIKVALHDDVTHVAIVVADTGIGINTEALSQVFHPFVQEKHATRFHGAGLGIGLTVVRELVEAHGGTVEVFSAGVGHGSRFVVTLPQVAEGAESAHGDAQR